MAHHQLGHAKEGRQWLDGAAQWIDAHIEELPPPPGVPPDPAVLPPSRTRGGQPRRDWTARLVLQLLRREAESLIQPPSRNQ